MGLTALITLMAMAALVVPQGEGRLMDALVVCGAAAAALLAAMVGLERWTLRETLVRHRLAAALFAAFFLWLLVQVWILPDGGLAWARGRLSLLVIAALGIAALATAAAALRQGAAEAIDVVLAFGVIAGVATMMFAPFTEAVLLAPTGLAGVSVLAVFAGLEGYRRARRSALSAADPAPLAQRLFLPGAAFAACASALAAAQDLSALLAGTAGMLGLGAMSWLRARAAERRAVLAFAVGPIGVGLALFGMVRLLNGGDASLDDGSALGAALAEWEQRPFTGIGLEGLSPDSAGKEAAAAAQLLAETGLIGAGLGAAAAAAGTIALAMTLDRERRPSRAGALCCGLVLCLATSAITSPALTHAAPALTFACLLGLSAAYGDRKKARSMAGLSATEPARVGMQRL